MLSFSKNIVSFLLVLFISFNISFAETNVEEIDDFAIV
jgi:hypothetical protein